MLRDIFAPKKMKKLLLLGALLAAGVSTYAQKASHVVLITIDGFRPEFYTDASWGMFNLRHLKDNGVAADGVNCIFPSVTYPDHTSIITGVTPAKHGIFYNAPFEPAGATGRWYWHYEAIKTPTLYDLVRQAGKTSANVIWPVTVGAPVDYNVPDIWPVGGNKDRRELTASVCTPATLWKEVQENATGTMAAADITMENGELIMDENVARIGAYLIRTYKPALTTLHLPCADHYEHEEGRDGLLVRKAVAGADRALGTVIESLKRAGIYDSTVIIVTGDHGFVNVKQIFSPNILLAKNSLMNNIAAGDWKAQFHTSGGAAFLHLKNKNDVATLNKVKALLHTLPANQQAMFKIIDQQQLASVGADPNAAMALAASDGVNISGTVKGELVKAGKGGAHGYFPDFRDIQTGFVAFGPGLKKGVVVKEMKVTDVAPVVAKLLGLSFGEIDGKIPAGILQ
ncbi:Predicted pyrophosphatase or phosphodiesterase, AlkP superfamily [Chitinophaga jiangningensis]|uniref:Predicted pyrophosphatase or phosphodiesterase, AlkP superfamily n=2 Tax=Chitinophaga jiangningensis TaxID=1419482 RepID=A0A1M6VRC3_9BACT|nr:Predicted pyrophosphatase or phosphodiesterase, AlkP superfamily [Chitinophaga jiangningensis]